MQLTDKNKEIIRLHSKEVFPNECCGLLVNINSEILALPCKNISKTPEKSFIIDPKEVSKYNLNNIVGFYHSHQTNGEFSLGDISFSEKLKKSCVLYIIKDDVFKIYKPNGFLIPYIGRPMFGGFIDCVSLFQDYYKRELNIILNGDITHPLRYDHLSWTEKQDEMIKLYGYPNILEDYLIINNFKKVNDIRKYDILLFQMPHLWIPSHLGIFLGDNQILHHFYEFSDITTYNNAFKRITVGRYRHINFI